MPIHSGGCPRCGLRDVGSFKYCPNCAYRLVPEIVGAHPEAREGVPLGERLVALGGYLAVTSLLLLVVLAGIRLFMDEELASAVSAPAVSIPRDGEVPLDRARFVEIPGGTVLLGPLGPARWDEQAEGDRAAAERDGLEALDAAQALAVLREWMPDPAGVRAELGAALSDWAASRLEDAREALSEAISKAASSRGFDTPRPWGTIDDPFEISPVEVTNDQYFEFLTARARRAGRTPEGLYPADWTRKSGDGLVERIYDGGHGDFPVAGIPFGATLEFCAWVWEEKLGADRDLMVDLPTDVEFIHAGRRNRASHNFPWGPAFDDPGARFVLRGEPRAVDDEAVGSYDGLHALVGNVAEWVWGVWAADHEPLAAGWSFKRSDILQSFYNRGIWRTPFGEEGFEYVSRPREDVGFRILIRREPALPELVPVGKGVARHRDDYRNPVVDQLPREEPVPEEAPAGLVLAGSRTVAADFAIARSETTNRQYLEFLIDASRTRNVVDMGELQPRTWDRLHPYADATRLKEEYYSLLRVPIDKFSGLGLVSEFFEGPLGDPRKIPFLYRAGHGNRPVQGISLEQAEAYATWLSGRLGARCRVPTVAEYLRAGRGDRLDPYPWGESASSRELVCGGRMDSEGRAVSLLGRLFPTAPPIVGLAGNLPEFVVDERDGRALLAGGCFLFPAEACTLDSFLDASWEYVEWLSRDEDPPIAQDLPYRLSYYPGFRVVRAP